MAHLYCTATNTGVGFFTHSDRTSFFLCALDGIWVVGNKRTGRAWIQRVNGTPKTAAEAQAIVDGKVEEQQAEWDNLTEAQKTSSPVNMPRPVKYTLP